METVPERSNLPPLNKNRSSTPSEQNTEAVTPLVAKANKIQLRSNTNRKENSSTPSSAEVVLPVDAPAPRRRGKKRPTTPLEPMEQPEQDFDSEYFDEMVRVNGEMVFSDDDNEESKEERRRREEERRRELERIKEEERRKEEERKRNMMKSERDIKRQLEEEKALQRLRQEEEELLEYQYQTLCERAVYGEETIEEKRQSRASRASQQSSGGRIQLRKQEEKPTYFTI